MGEGGCVFKKTIPSFSLQLAVGVRGLLREVLRRCFLALWVGRHHLVEGVVRGLRLGRSDRRLACGLRPLLAKADSGCRSLDNGRPVLLHVCPHDLVQLLLDQSIVGLLLKLQRADVLEYGLEFLRASVIFPQFILRLQHGVLLQHLHLVLNVKALTIVSFSSERQDSDSPIISSSMKKKLQRSSRRDSS